MPIVEYMNYQEGILQSVGVNLSAYLPSLLHTYLQIWNDLWFNVDIKFLLNVIFFEALLLGATNATQLMIS